jgi:LuxR family transcriptional regulator, maltose regulon positive regulatory protein
LSKFWNLRHQCSIFEGGIQVFCFTTDNNIRGQTQRHTADRDEKGSYNVLMAETLLRTKVFVPPQRPNLIPRPRLISLLNQGLQPGHKLTLISASAGFGKTTLLSHWVNQSGIPGCWYSLDEKDNDFGRFVSYSVASLQSIGIEADSQILTLLQSPQTSKIEALLIPLINQISTYDGLFAMILDDYHLIREEKIHNALTFLLNHLPSNMRLVIATRADPPLPLAILRARGELTEIRSEHLRFSLAESDHFLKQELAYELPQALICSLVDKTDGWISALQMATLSLRFSANPGEFIHKFAGSHQYVFDYLTEEVLSRQTEATTRFLLRTSVLGRLSGALCDAVTGMEAGQQTLERLQETNTFIVPLDEERHWFRYHRLFADMLLQRLQQLEPDSIKALHQRASGWFEAQGLWPEAIEHALLGEAFGKAAEFIERSAERTLLQGEIRTFLKWVGQLPSVVVRERPLLYLYYLHTLLLSGTPIVNILEQSTKAAEHVGVLALTSSYQGDYEGSLEYTRQALHELPEDSYFLKSIIASASAAVLLMTGDVSRAIQGFQSAIQYAKSGNNLLTEVIGTTRIAQLLAIAGRVSKAQAMCQRACELATDSRGQYLPLASFPLFYQAYLYRESNNLEKALNTVYQAIELSDKHGGFWATDCYIVYALILQDLQKHDAASEAMENARRLARETSANPFDDLYSAIYEAQLWIAQGQLAAASHWARQRNLVLEVGEDKPSVHPLFFHFHELQGITLARLYIAERNPAEALKILASLEDEMVRLSRVSSLIENHLLQARAYDLKGDRQLALGNLQKALRLAGPEGAVRLFLNERPAIDPLLYRLSAQGIETALARKLISLDQPYPERKIAPQKLDLGEKLSEREMEILRMLESDLPIPEIAANMTIALSTLRTHIRNIYSKLDTHSRFETVSKARELNIL